MTRCETLRRSCNINLAQPRPASCKASSRVRRGLRRAERYSARKQRGLCKKCDLATRAPSRPIESFDASSEADVRILKFYLHAPCKRDDNRKKARRNFKISFAAVP